VIVKRYFMAIALLMTVGFVQAQTKFGLKAGANLSTFTGKSYTDNSLKAGFHAGGFAEIKASEKLFVQLELLYSEQGAKIDFSQWIPDAALRIKYDEKWNLNYLNIPVMLKYYVYKGFNIEAGPQIGILLKAEEKYESNFTSPDFPEGTIRTSGKDDITEHFKSIDVAINAGVGYDFTSHIFANARYSYGIIDIYDFSPNSQSDVPGQSIDITKSVARNNVLSVAVGYKF